MGLDLSLQGQSQVFLGEQNIGKIWGNDDSDQDSMWLATVLLVVCGAGFVALFFEG